MSLGSPTRAEGGRGTPGYWKCRKASAGLDRSSESLVRTASLGSSEWIVSEGFPDWNQRMVVVPREVLGEVSPKQCDYEAARADLRGI